MEMGQSHLGEQSHDPGSRSPYLFSPEGNCTCCNGNGVCPTCGKDMIRWARGYCGSYLHDHHCCPNGHYWENSIEDGLTEIGGKCLCPERGMDDNLEWSEAFDQDQEGR